MRNKYWFWFLAATLAVCTTASAQKGKADPDYYPLGYTGDTWAGKVITVKERALTLQEGKQTFAVVIPSTPYLWTSNGYRHKVLDFQGGYFKFNGFDDRSSAGLVGPSGSGVMTRLIPHGDPISTEDLNQFLGRKIIAYYFKEKNNYVVWRIELIAKK